MKKNAAAMVIALALTATGYAQEHQEHPSDPASLSAQVDKLFAAFNKPDSPGCAVAVIKNGAIIYEHGYGMSNLEYDLPITASSIFHIASISKQFTSMAILMLANQGKLSLDDDVRKYVPEVPDFDSKITIRNLMHHTSGLRDQWEMLYLAGSREDDLKTHADLLAMVTRQKELNFKPGDDYSYSNTGFTLMAEILKRVTGQTLRQYAQENIFMPLGMSHTHFHDDHTEIVKGRTSAYQPRPAGGYRISIPVFDNAGASSLFTTVEDFALWDKNFYDRKVGGPAVIGEMFTPGVFNNGVPQNYGGGLFIDKYKGLRMIGHNGADAGYRSGYVQFPDQHFSAISFCNYSVANPANLVLKIADIYLAWDFTKDSPASPAAEIRPVKLTEADLTQRAGIYFNPITEATQRLYMSNGKLMFAAGPIGLPLTPLAKDKFQVKGDRVAELTFETSSAGEVVLKLSVNKEPPLSFRAVKLVSPSSGQLEGYSGAYYSDELDSTNHIVLKDGKLSITFTNGEALTLSPLFADAFTTPLGGTIRFTRDQQKQISGFLLSTDRTRRLRFSRR